eukprot:364406-Chlamydomonas_euryale.AAC.11
MPARQSQSQSYRERTHKGYAGVERSKTERIKQRAGCCHKGSTTVAGRCQHRQAERSTGEGCRTRRQSAPEERLQRVRVGVRDTRSGFLQGARSSGFGGSNEGTEQLQAHVRICACARVERSENHTKGAGHTEFEYSGGLSLEVKRHVCAGSR